MIYLWEGFELPNIQSSINQLIGFVGKIEDQYDEAQKGSGFTPSTIKIGNQRKTYQNSTAHTNYKKVMQNLANKISDRKRQKTLHNDFMNIIRPGSGENKGV